MAYYAHNAADSRRRGRYWDEGWTGPYWSRKKYLSLPTRAGKIGDKARTSVGLTQFGYPVASAQLFPRVSYTRLDR